MNNAVKYVLAGVAGLGIGFGAGYLVRQRKAQKDILELRQELDAQYEDLLARRTKTGPYATVESAAAVLQQSAEDSDIQTSSSDESTSLVDEAKELEPDFPIDESDLPTPESTEKEEENPLANAAEFMERFRNRSASENYGGVSFPGQSATDTLDADDADIPVKTVPDFVTVRDPNGPYVISIDEYMDDEETPFSKVEMTYFVGDSVLIDSREQIVPDINRTVGLKNLDRWGEGTTDPEQVYIRNERLEIDIELTRDEGTYLHAVLGQQSEEEIRRSMTKPLKMRESDGD